jgi:hypothetical protein
MILKQFCGHNIGLYIFFNRELKKERSLERKQPRVGSRRCFVLASYPHLSCHATTLRARGRLAHPAQCRSPLNGVPVSLQTHMAIMSSLDGQRLKGTLEMHLSNMAFMSSLDRLLQQVSWELGTLMSMAIVSSLDCLRRQRVREHGRQGNRLTTGCPYLAQ